MYLMFFGLFFNSFYHANNDSDTDCTLTHSSSSSPLPEGHHKILLRILISNLPFTQIVVYFLSNLSASHTIPWFQVFAFFCNSYWLLISILYFSTKLFSLTVNHFYSILENRNRSVICEMVFVSRGITVVIFILFGNIPVWNDLIMIMSCFSLFSIRFAWYSFLHALWYSLTCFYFLFFCMSFPHQ